MSNHRGLGPSAGGVLALALACNSAAAQSSFEARLSADTVQMGEVFELLVRVPVPAGSVVYFPDTVAATQFLESYAPVRWEAEPSADAGAMLTLAYPVMAYGYGVVPVSGFDVFVGPAGGARQGAPLPGGSVIGDWSDEPARGNERLRPLRVPRRGVWVSAVFTPEQLEAGVDPLPSNDVVGSSWHWPSALLALVSVALLAGVAVRPVLARPARGRVTSETAWTPEASRREALDALDRLRAEGLHEAGRTHELYTRSSGIVRRYLGRLDPGCGADLTASELLCRLVGGANGGSAPGGPGEPVDADRPGRPSLRDEAAPFFQEMRTAEVVKFGRLRPRGEETDAHLSAVRAWVEASGAIPW